MVVEVAIVASGAGGEMWCVGVSVSDKTIMSYIMFYVHYTSRQARLALGASARVHGYLVQKAPA